MLTRDLALGTDHTKKTKPKFLSHISLLICKEKRKVKEWAQGHWWELNQQWPDDKAQ